MKWPRKYVSPTEMIVLAIPCQRAEMQHYGMQACDLNKKIKNT
jgi:hypothetical protein